MQTDCLQKISREKFSPIGLHMNERVRHLVNQSGIDVYGLGLDRLKWESKVDAFAQLIIRECMDVILTWESEPFPLDPKYGAQMIAEHFGVQR